MGASREGCRLSISTSDVGSGKINAISKPTRMYITHPWLQHRPKRPFAKQRIGYHRRPLRTKRDCNLDFTEPAINNQRIFDMPQNETWYFSYGSNLSKQQMLRRTGSIPMSQLACLANYRLAFRKEGGTGIACRVH